MASSSKSIDSSPPASDEAALRARVAQATELLQELAADLSKLAVVSPDDRRRLLTAAGQVARPGPWEKKKLAKAALKRRREQIRARDDSLLESTGIRVKREDEVFQTPQLPAPTVAANAAAAPAPDPAPKRLVEPRTCYVCKVDFHELHDFYDQMCPSCATLNWEKRHQTCDLSGRVALVTGARVKIGYQAAIKLLRAGAHVIVTTRFPRDAAQRYAREDDFENWSQRLEIHGLDLRHTPSVELFCRHLLESHHRLDFILNNACQTVRRPPDYYEHLMSEEMRSASQLEQRHLRLLGSYEAWRGQVSQGLVAAESSQAIGFFDPAALSQLRLLEEDREVDKRLFPLGVLDQDLQQVDERSINSWRLLLHEVSAVEMLEVQLINAVAPFLINARLKPLMERVATRDKHIVNVSAMEGQFARRFKTDKHPHTNMAKAALNMMTRTSAVDYVRSGIHMNSVDTGWVTDEDPREIARRKREIHRFHPPLDIVDGAARICDPIIAGIRSGTHVWGLFLKDYQSVDW